MRLSSLLLMIALGLTGCEDSWTCDDDEAISSLDGKCTRRKSAGGGGPSGGSGDGGGLSSDGGASTDGGGVDPRLEAHGRACTSDADCLPLAPHCSTQVKKCPTAGCCVSSGCDENDPSTCPEGFYCLYVGYGIDETFCVFE